MRRFKKILFVGNLLSSLIGFRVQEGEGISTDFDENLFTGKDTLVKKVGASLVFQQFRALILKRLICLRISIIMGILCVLIIPLVFTVITFLIHNKIMGVLNTNALSLNLNQYGKTTVLVDGKNESIVNSYIKKVRSENSVDILSSIHTLEELTHAKDLRRFGNKMIVAADFRRDTPVAFYSSNAYHGAAIAIDMLFNAFINNASNQSTPKSIEITNHPYSLSTENECNPMEPSLVHAIPVLSTSCGLGVLFSLSYFLRFPITERSNGMKQLQYMSGLSPLVYWASNMLFDFALFCIILVVLLVTGFALDYNRLFYDIDLIGYFVLLMILYALAMFATCYSMSFLFKSHSGAMNVLLLGSQALALMPLAMDFLTSEESIFHYLFHFSPTTPFIASTYHIGQIAIHKFMCEKCKNKHKLAPFFCLRRQERYIIVNIKFLAVDLVLFSLLTLAFDYRLIQLCFHNMKENNMGPIVTETGTVDSDVLAEKRKVAAFTQDEEDPGLEGINAKNRAATNRSSLQPNDSQSLISDSENYVLITDSLGKRYKKRLTAVHDVSFAVKKGECFGLLGVNGAGKTTTFSMLTGDIFPSRGDASIQVPSGYFTLKNSRSLFLRYIGYCPQENYITEEMTGRQLLKTFALLRGASPSDSKKLIQHWIRNLDLHLYCDKACGKYSGGNKRKLCSAIALIADPPLILMDEPTTGVDPVTKRKLWKVLKQIQLNEQTIILTSHSMDECEALCDRLTIMVAGRMRCIGNIQYLKHKFAQGFTILIKTQMSATNEQVQEIKNAMFSAFGPLCLLKDEYKGFIHYHLRDTNYKWSELFGKMAGIKRDFESVDEYMVSDTSLEQVFLTLAKQQKPRPQ